MAELMIRTAGLVAMNVLRGRVVRSLLVPMGPV